MPANARSIILSFLLAASVCFPIQSLGQVGFAHYHATSSTDPLSLPEDYLQYVRKNGFKYVVLHGELALISPPGSNDWVDGRYNYGTGAPKLLHNALVREFRKTARQKVRLVPLFSTGARWSRHWEAVNNPNIHWNQLTTRDVNGNLLVLRTPVYARQLNGMDRSYPSLLNVIKQAHSEAMGGLLESERYPLEYIHIGHDEVYADINGTLTLMSARPASGTSNADTDSLNYYRGFVGSYLNAHHKLMAREIARRVQNVKDAFPTANPPVKVLMWGDMMDPNHNGGLAMLGWTPGGSVQVNTMSVLQHADLAPYKDRLVVMPWWTFNGRSAEQTLDFINNAGFSFAPAASYDETERYYTWAEARGVMREFVRAGSLSKYGSRSVGYCANNWTDGNAYWNWPSNPRPLQFLIVPEMARAARFFKDTTDFVRLWSSSSTNPPQLRIDRFRAAPLSSGSKFVRTVGTTDMGESANLGFLVGNVRGSLRGDVREDFIKLRSSGSNLRADVYRSTGSDFAWIGGGADLGPSTNILAVLAGDFDGDGATDIINLTNNAGRIRWVGARSTGDAFQVVIDIPQYGGSIGQFFTADHNRDGRTDVLQLWDNAGRLGFEAYESRRVNGVDIFQHVWATPDIGGYTGRFLTGDVDRDGRTDVFHLWDNSGRLAIDVYRSTGGGYAHPANNQNVGGWGGQFYTGDYDGDGHTDIYQVWNNNGVQHVEVYSPDASQRFALRKGTGSLGTTNVQQYLARDWNADGRTDLVKLITNSSGRLEIEVLQATGASSSSSTPGFTVPYRSAGTDMGAFGLPYIALDFSGNR